MHGIEASERGIFCFSALRAFVVVREREGNYFPFAYELRRAHDILGPRVVKRADFVVGAPLSPIFQTFRGRADVLHGELAHRLSRSRHSFLLMIRRADWARTAAGYCTEIASKAPAVSSLKF